MCLALISMSITVLMQLALNKKKTIFSKFTNLQMIQSTTHLNGGNGFLLFKSRLN